jgi:hypothetical protein
MRFKDACERMRGNYLGRNAIRASVEHCGSVLALHIIASSSFDLI